MHRLVLITLLTIVGIAMLGLPLHAQRMGAHFGPGGFGHNGAGHRSNFGDYDRFGRGGLYYPYGLADFYPDYLDSGYPVASQPPVIVIQAPPNPTAEHTPEEPTPEVHPLVIELRGDRYLRINDDEDGSAVDGGDERSSSPSGMPQAAQSRVEPRSAILIFRDGHREEVSAYTIAGGVLYARADYYAAGTWMKNVDLSGLNVPETIAANQSRGVPFHLPASPNEVMVGP